MLTFNSDTHSYFWSGVPMISVTQAIGAAGLIQSEWFTEFARERGRAVHLATQYDDEGILDESTVDLVVKPYLSAYQSFKRDTGFIPELVEYRVCLPSCGYAGTLDRAGLIDRKQKVLLDLKTGEVPFWARYQLAAYAPGVPDGSTYTRFAVQLKSDATYRIRTYPVKTFRRDYADFLAILRVADLRRQAGCL